MTNSEKIPWQRLTAEGAAIVVSILLAFWIDAWWENREQKLQLIGNLQALEAEIEFNQLEISQSLEAIAYIFGKMDSVFEILADPESEALADEFLTNVGMGYVITVVDVTNSAYDVVVSPENLRLIENTELRSSLTEARQKILEIPVSRQILWSEYSDRQGPYLASQGLVSEMGWIEQQEALIQSGMLRPLPEPPYTRDAAALKTSEFWFLYEHWRVLYFDYVWILSLAQQAQERSLELLRDELNSLAGMPAE